MDEEAQEDNAEVASYEVGRLFLSTLLLANAGTIEIVETEGGEDFSVSYIKPSTSKSKKKNKQRKRSKRTSLGDLPVNVA